MQINANKTCCAFSTTNDIRNALYQYTICTFPQNKFPAYAKFAELRNNQNWRMETLVFTLSDVSILAVYDRVTSCCVWIHRVHTKKVEIELYLPVQI